MELLMCSQKPLGLVCKCVFLFCLFFFYPPCNLTHFRQWWKFRFYWHLYLLHTEVLSGEALRGADQLLQKPLGSTVK